MQAAAPPPARVGGGGGADDDRAPTFVHVLVVGAKHLLFADNIAGPVPPSAFVVLRLGERRFETVVVPSSSSPVFEQVLSLGAVDLRVHGASLLHVSVLDSSPLVPDENLGSAEINLAALFARDTGGGVGAAVGAGDRAWDGTGDGAWGLPQLRHACLSLEGVESGEVLLRFLASRSAELPARRELSIAALAKAEAARQASFNAPRHRRSGGDAESMDNVQRARRLVVGCYLWNLEKRQFWRWCRTLNTNAWLLARPWPRASLPSEAQSEVARLVAGGIPGKGTCGAQVRAVAVRMQSKAHGTGGDLAHVSAEVRGWRVVESVVLFRVAVDAEQSSWTVWRRHSDFTALAALLDPDGGLDPVRLGLRRHADAVSEALKVDAGKGPERLGERLGAALGSMVSDVSSHVFGSLEPQFLAKRRENLDALLQVR